jgi:hypothetical protein
MPIPRTDAELIAQGVTLLARLARHLDALENGDATAGDDLASVLRILIGKSTGNRAVLRLAKAANLALPRVWVSGRPESAPDPHLLIAFGNLPVDPNPKELGQPHEPHWMGFRDWVEAPSFIVPSSQRGSESWGSFATLAGNTTGSHMSEVYHDLLVTSDMFSSSGLSFQSYLLRQIGWQVERVLADLLGQAGQPVTAPTRRLDQWPRLLVWGWFRDEPGVGHEMMFAVNVMHDDGPPIEVMRYAIRGRTSRILHGGGRVSVESDKPSGGMLKVWSGT